jgi:hypothetical protein
MADTDEAGNPVLDNPPGAAHPAGTGGAIGGKRAMARLAVAAPSWR